MSRRNLGYSATDHARDTDPWRRKVAGMIRRMTVDLTDAVLWKLLGHTAVEERPRAEVYSGIGFYARPPAGVTAEVVVTNIGGADHPIVVASRDEETRAAIADLDEGETASFNDQTILLHKSDGTIEARSANGAAVALATRADLEALLSAISGAAVLAGDGGATFKTNLLAALAGWPVGTTVLKGE